MDEKVNEAMKSFFEKLTDEQKEKAKACKNTDELLKLAGEWGIEIPDELAGMVTGGGPAIDAIMQSFVPGETRTTSQIYADIMKTNM